MERRHFLLGSVASAGALSSSAPASPNERIRVACVGVRGRGRSHLDAYSKMPDVEIAAICDIDEAVLNQRLKDVEAKTGKRPAGFTDYRKLLDDKSIHAVSIATQNHNHTLQTVWACQAGKDVYVEKPCSHNIFEARQIVAAARKYDRIVQHGTQSRSSGALREAARKLKEGMIGEVYMSRGLCIKWRDTIGHKPEKAVPSGVHYDAWVGPAPMKPFTENRFHYNWHWFWDYGNGDIGNQGIHQMDIARWLLGGKYPTRVSAMGGKYMFTDDQETPNTLVATFDYVIDGKPKLLVFEVRHWLSNDEAGIREGRAKDTNVIGNMVYGSNGYLVVGNGYRTFLGKERQPGPESKEGGDNFGNFIQVMRSRNRSEQNAPIEEGADSTVLVHLANISYRLKRSINFDGEKMVCPGDSEATALFTRNYRTPYVVPEKV
ncbi:MAG: Gfo/Idh/MocA family oxidoreductase [Acidobacteria bacterium]|nr:Gfo/Idh/MocA family oxidoreductase [Acidobacteriota bacterium]